MAHLPEKIQIECSECRTGIIEDTEWVLEVGSENLICEDCYETEQGGYVQPAFEKSGSMGLTEMIFEIGKWLVLPFLLFVVVEAVLPGVLPLVVLPIWGLIGGCYVTYLGHTEKSWLAAILGLYVLYRSGVTLFQMV